MLERIWKWKEQFGNRIINQLKKLGCSCDWDRTCFTMDDKLSYAVRTVFLQLFEDELIYRGKRLINWCPGCRTALSNDELVHKDHKANLWEIKYPVKDSDQFIVVATTRPETMLGDTAVAVHSKDERYKDLLGKNCIVPLINREIPIIADDILADPEKGTGAVKVTPGHDPNDYACGNRNNLEKINILNEDGTLNENAGKYEGLDVQSARKKVLADLKELDLLGKIEDIEHAVAHCYRSDDVVEPYLSDQWFVKMEPLVKMARKAAEDKEVIFFPEKRTEDYLRWLDQTPDWCISRQIWWGHRIPIWYCCDCCKEIEIRNGEPIYIPVTAKPILPNKDNAKIDPVTCPVCGGKNLIQDPDVLDTWFSSQLWPLSTFGWPEDTKDLEYYYPTNVLVTARDIIALWVARMVMMGLKFKDVKPFSHVFIHGTIQDEHGDIMSKSRGNGLDPVKIIEGGKDEIHGKAPLGDIPADRVEHYPVYGCDALRYSIMSMTSGQGQDIKLIVQRAERKDKSYDVKVPLLEEGRRFCNKIWQACHGVIFKNCEEFETFDKESSYIEDMWLSDKLHNLITTCTTSLDKYKIGDMCNALYQFFWNDLCAWYLEIVKPRLWGNDGEESKRFAQSLLIRSTDTFLRLLHPVMPFISEELWQNLRPLMQKSGYTDLPEACIIADWPKAENFKAYPDSCTTIEVAREITSAINNIRAEQNLAPGKKIPQAIFTGKNEALITSLEPLWEGIKKLTKIENVEAKAHIEKPKQTAVRVVGDIIIYIPLTGLIDFEKEKEKIGKELQKVDDHIEKLEKKLSNENYTKKAPEHVVNRDKDKLEELKKQREQLKEQQGLI